MLAGVFVCQKSAKKLSGSNLARSLIRLRQMELIGIAGGTCSGKSTLLHGLVEKLGDNVAALSFDDYFIGSDLYNLDDITDFEDPGLYNFDGFIRDLSAIKQGEGVTIRANSRESAEAGISERTIPNKPVVIVEGWLIYHRPEARELFDLKVFVEIPEEDIVLRRFARTKGASHWDDPNYIQNKIIPGHRKYVEPQKEYADLVLDGTAPKTRLVSILLEQIPNLGSSIDR
jgi:uridine kinase